MNWDLSKLFKKVSHTVGPTGTEPVLDRKKRASLMDDTSHTTPVSGMRTSWGLLSAYWRSNAPIKPFDGWALLNKKKINPQTSPWVVAGAIAVLIIAANGALSIGTFHAIKSFWDAMILKDVMGMATQIGYMAGLLKLTSLTGSMTGYLADSLRLYWQEWLTDKLTKAYLLDKAFFHIHLNPGTIDNPQQRMSDAPEKLLSHTIGLGMGALNAATLLTSSLYIMFSSMPFSAAAIGLAAAFTHAAAGTWLAKKVYNPLILLNEKQLQKNADFNLNISKIDLHASEIASYPNQEREKERLDNSLSKMVDNYQMIRDAKFFASFVGGVYTGSRDILKCAAVANAYFTTAMTFGSVMQYAALFDKLSENLSWCINVNPAYVEFKAQANRITDLAQRIESVQNLKGFYSEQGAIADVQTHHRDQPSIIFKNVKLNTPENRLLISIPHLEINKGERVLIQGKSGCGKSTILRAMFDQWKYGSGDISMPKDQNILYATQTPLVFKGATLRENITHPYPVYKKKVHPNDPDQLTFSNDECHRALKAVGLSELIPFLDHTGRPGQTNHSWEDLSGGQKQMLVFARMLLMKYDVIVLDEATSAMDPEMQETLYRQLVKRNPDATIISIAHRSEIGRFHNRFLAVTETGNLLESIKPTPNKPRLMEVAI